jgi:hypothetical protein
MAGCLARYGGVAEHARGATGAIQDGVEASGVEANVGGLKRVENALIWPFQKEEIKGIFNTIERQKALFSLVLQNDHMYVSNRIRFKVGSPHRVADYLKPSNSTFRT